MQRALGRRQFLGPTGASAWLGEASATTRPTCHLGLRQQTRCNFTRQLAALLQVRVEPFN